MQPAKDRTEPGRELASGVTYSLLVSRNGGRSFNLVVRSRKRPIRRSIGLRGRHANVVAVTACDGNGNCSARRIGRYRP